MIEDKNIVEFEKKVQKLRILLKEGIISSYEFNQIKQKLIKEMRIG